jgi:hypothetical protein
MVREFYANYRAQGSRLVLSEPCTRFPLSSFLTFRRWGRVLKRANYDVGNTSAGGFYRHERRS